MHAYCLPLCRILQFFLCLNLSKSSTNLRSQYLDNEKWFFIGWPLGLSRRPSDNLAQNSTQESWPTTFVSSSRQRNLSLDKERSSVFEARKNESSFGTRSYKMSKNALEFLISMHNPRWVSFLRSFSKFETIEWYIDGMFVLITVRSRWYEHVDRLRPQTVHFETLLLRVQL